MRSLLLNLAAAAVSLFLTLLLFELGVRVYRGKLLDTSLLSAASRPPTREQEQPRAQYHPLLGWVPNLGKRTIGAWRYTILDGNIRSNGRERESIPDGESILAVGDSFTFGDDVNDEETWPAYLERGLRRRVINGGVFAYGLDQIVLRLEELARRYRAKTAIVSFIPDDVRRCALSVRENPKPYFGFRNGELLLRNVPVPPPQPLQPPDRFRSTAGYSHLVDLVMRRVHPWYWLDAHLALASEGGFHEAESASAGAALDIGCALLSRTASLAKRARLRTLVLIQHEQWLSEEDRAIAAAMMGCAAAQGLPVLDLYQTLLSLRETDRPHFAELFAVHMTPAGNEWVAHEVMQALKR